MEKKFNSQYERVGYYCIQYEDAIGWRAKAECLLDWYKALLYANGGADSDTEWYLYNKCGDELLNSSEYEYTEDDFEWYAAAQCAISNNYLAGAAV